MRTYLFILRSQEDDQVLTRFVETSDLESSIREFREEHDLIFDEFSVEARSTLEIGDEFAAELILEIESYMETRYEEMTSSRQEVLLAFLHGEGFFNVIEAWRNLEERAREPI